MLTANAHTAKKSPFIIAKGNKSCDDKVINVMLKKRWDDEAACNCWRSLLGRFK